MSLQMRYDSDYETLLSYRMHLISELEKISTQIADLKRDARKEGIVLSEPAQRKSLIEYNVR
jgi:hypothetical protein